jgi:hypothetical protein
MPKSAMHENHLLSCTIYAAFALLLSRVTYRTRQEENASEVEEGKRIFQNTLFLQHWRGEGKMLVFLFVIW